MSEIILDNKINMRGFSTNLPEPEDVQAGKLLYRVVKAIHTHTDKDTPITVDLAAYGYPASAIAAVITHLHSIGLPFAKPDHQTLWIGYKGESGGMPAWLRQ